MPRYRRARTGQTYFFTLVTYQRRPLLCEPVVREALRMAIASVRVRRPFIADAFVLLPDHLHCIWTLPEGDADYSLRWMMIKRMVSMRCGPLYPCAEMGLSRRRHRESGIWQRRFWEHQVRDDDDMARHVDYIHYNPVHYGLVEDLAAWPYSSFHRYVRDGIYPADWACPPKVQRLDFE